MRKGPDELGLFRRIVVMILGLALMSNLAGDTIPEIVLGLFGLTIFLAAFGVVELAMALWYRTKRNRIAIQRAGRHT